MPVNTHVIIPPRRFAGVSKEDASALPPPTWGPAKAPSITTRSYTLRRYPVLGGAPHSHGACVPTRVSLLPLLPRRLDRITKCVLNIEHLDEHEQEDSERGSKHKTQAPEEHPEGDLRGNRQGWG